MLRAFAVPRQEDLPAVHCDVLVLGGGLTGLAAAGELGSRAIVLERDERPGGLVRTERFGKYFFDRVIHLLHFRDTVTQERIRALLGETLAPCPPEAFVECAAGTARFPLQSHLHGLSLDARKACLRDFAQAAGAEPGRTPCDYRDFLLRSFGSSLCELFFFPYNRKMWKRPLETLAPADFQWNIARPHLGDVVRGAFDPSFRGDAYNANGWYPRPTARAQVRGMEVLSRALAARVHDLRLRHEVVSVDLDRQSVVAQTPTGPRRFVFKGACLSTIPLPVLVSRCVQTPASLREACNRLRWNRVISVALSVRGRRPDLGHWRYYADESIAFTRLVFLHAFDPLLAPAEGWPLLAEIPQRAEDARESETALVSRVEADVVRSGVIAPGSRVVDAHVMTVDPAYVVFSRESAETIQRARSFFSARGVTPLGRYGHWRYSSMAQDLRDGYAFADAMTQGAEASAAAGA